MCVRIMLNYSYTYVAQYTSHQLVISKSKVHSVHQVGQATRWPFLNNIALLNVALVYLIYAPICID